MQELINILIEIGGPGMFLAAFFAGTVAPFASEIVMVGLHQLGMGAAELLLWGTLGNTLGAMFNYWIGSLGNLHRIGKLFRITPEKLEQGKRIAQQYGAWSGLLAWIPLLGSVVSVALGLLRVNIFKCSLAFAVGKCARYAFLLYLSSTFH